MAANFGGNQMMMQTPSPAANTLQQMLISQIQQNVGHVTGWQANVGVGERFSHVWQMVSQLRLVNSGGQHELQKICGMALQFEKGTFDNALDKETYIKAIREKMDHLTNARTQIGVNTQAQLQAQAQAQVQAQAQAHQAHHAQAQAQAQAQRQVQAHQMNMMNQAGLQSQLQRTGMGQQPPQPFHHLQHPMQASPITAQQQSLQVPMGMVNNGLPPNMANQQQQQFQMNMQQQQPLQQQVPPEKRPQPGLNNFTPQDQIAVNNMVQSMLARMPEEEKQNKRNQIRAQMDPTLLAKCQTQSIDPLMMQLRNQSIHLLRQKKMQNLNELQLQQSRSRQGISNAPSSTPMQPQRSSNPTLINGQGPQQTQVGVNQDFGSFVGSVGDMIGQQHQAGVLAQDAGQIVVPASVPQGSSAPQTMQGLQGPQIGANGQRPLSNPNVRPQPIQQPFNAQQAPSQAQMRANASAKAQQMALRGQPGGMGPMPPAQSPAMTTLNAPLRTPQQTQAANPVDPLQLNQPSMAHFGAPLDPRYAQGNQPRSNQGSVMNSIALNGPMFPADMPQETRQRIMALPKDRLNEVLGKWNASHQGQAGKPQTGMAMNVQGARPNQQANPAAQFNRQGMPNQFVNGNQNGQQPQQHPMMANLSAQQQQLVRQRMAQIPPQQGRGPNGQAVVNPQEQHSINQIDHLEFPPVVYNNPLLRQAPPNLKRWGELKQWVTQNNLTMQNNTMDTLKGLQKMHFQSIRARNMQAHRQQSNSGLMNGASMGQPQPAPPVAPGMAPVAPMGQQPQLPINMADMQITGDDIQKARAHSSGKWTTASDDEIRQMIVKNHYSARQRELQQHQQMEMAQMAQLQPVSQTGPQRTPQPAPPRPPNPSQASKQGGRSQPGAPPAGSQQPPAGSDMTTPNPSNARAPRPAQPTKANPPASSSQPPKNVLKRASSDDIVEVPKPHVQQHSRPAAQQPGSQPKSLPPARGPPGANPPVSWAPAGVPRNPAQPPTQQPPFRVTAADTQRFQAIVQEEMSRMKPLPVIQMTPEVKRATDQKLSTLAGNFRMVKKSLPRWFAISKDEDRLRRFLRAYYVMSLQFQGQDMTEPLTDQFSINPEQIDQAYSLASSLVKDLSNKFPKLSKSANGVAGAGPAQNANRPVPNATSAVPLNAANLRQQQQALKQNNQTKAPNRSNSRNNVPPAPTSAHPPPFPPDAFANQLTADQLRLPQNKKVKLSASSTPVLGQQTPGPTTAQPVKQGSPEAKPQQPPQPTEPKKTGFYCPESHCDHHFLDEFPDAEALERHREEEHERPIQDPKKYALDHLALITSVDQDGTQKSSRSLAILSSAPGPKAENTPAATPMNRQASVSGLQASPANSKISKTPKADEPAAPRSTNGEQDLMDLTSVFDDDLWADSAVNPQDLVHNFAPLETGAGGAISDMSVYRSITPNDTPESSKDGISEPTSDISDGLDLNINLDFADLNQDWKPFGLGDMENLLDLDAMNVNLDDRMEEDILDVFERDTSQFVPWNEYMDPAAFDKPFNFDQNIDHNFFSLNAD